MAKRAKKSSSGWRGAGRGVAGRIFRAQGAGHRRAHRIHRRPDHVPDHGLHRVRQPGDPGKAGMDQGAVFVATCVAAAVSTMVMALYANYPIALAPGMGINAFFAFTVVLTYKYTWQQALAAVFCSGVLFFLISVFRIRQYVIEFDPAKPEARHIGRRRAVPRHHRAGGSQGRGRAAGDAGHARRPEEPGGGALMLLGFVLIVALNYRRIIGGTLIGISGRHRHRPAVRAGALFTASCRCRPRLRRRSCSSISRACSRAPS